MRGCVCGLLGIVVVGVNFVTLASAFSLEAFELVGSAQRTDAGGVRLTHDDDAGAKGIMFAKSIEGRTAWEFQLLLNAHGRKNQGGEGFAFWYVADPLHTGPVYGGPDTFYGFTLILSSTGPPSADETDHTQLAAGVSNAEDAVSHPSGWIGGFFNDGGHFDQQELVVGRHNGNSCSCDFRNHVVNDRGPTLLRISYDGADLVVRVSEPQEASFRDCFTIHDVELPSGFFYGVSASNSDTLADIHDVYALEDAELPSSVATNPPSSAGVQSASEETDDAARRGASGRLRSQGSLSDPDEASTLDFLVSQSDVVVALASQHREFSQRLALIEAGYDRELAALQSHYDILISKLTLAEQDTQRMMQHLETLVQTQLDAFKDEHIGYRHSWIAPFGGVVIILLLLTATGYNRYRFLVKRHVQ